MAYPGNPNCDGYKCGSKTGEVRLLPTGGSSNLILCRRCFDYEIAFRKDRNKELGKFAQFKLPAWEELEVYKNA
jgi:hypothetical protein